MSSVFGPWRGVVRLDGVKGSEGGDAFIFNRGRDICMRRSVDWATPDLIRMNISPDKARCPMIRPITPDVGGWKTMNVGVIVRMNGVPDEEKSESL